MLRTPWEETDWVIQQIAMRNLNVATCGGGSPLFIGIPASLLFNAGPMVQEQYVVDQNMKQVLGKEPRVYHDLQSASTSKTASPDEELDDGPPALSPMPPGEHYQPEEPVPSIRLEGQTPLEQKKKKARRTVRRGCKPWKDSTPREKPPMKRSRKAHLRLDEAQSERVINSKFQKGRISQFWYRAFENAVRGTNHNVPCLKEKKGWGGRPIKKSRGPKAKENNAQREYEATQRHWGHSCRRRELKNLCIIMGRAERVDEKNVNIDGTVFEEELILDVAECLADAICTEETNKFLEVRKTTFKKPKSHKAKNIFY